MIYSLFALTFLAILYKFFENLKNLFTLKISNYPEEKNISELFSEILLFLSKIILFSFSVLIVFLIILYFTYLIFNFSQTYFDIYIYLILGFLFALFISVLFFLLQVLLLKINFPFLKNSQDYSIYFLKNSLNFSILLIFISILFLYIIFLFSGGTEIELFKDMSFKIRFIWIGSCLALFSFFAGVKFIKNHQNENYEKYITLFLSFFFENIVYIISILIISEYFILNNTLIFNENIWKYYFISPLLGILSLLISLFYFDFSRKNFFENNFLNLIKLSIYIYFFFITISIWYFFRNMWLLIPILLGIFITYYILFIKNSYFNYITNKLLSLNSFERVLNFSIFYFIILLFYLIISFYSGIKSEMSNNFIYSGFLGINIGILGIFSVFFYILFISFFKNSIISLECFYEFVQDKSNIENNLKIFRELYSKPILLSFDPFMIFLPFFMIISLISYFFNQIYDYNFLVLFKENYLFLIIFSIIFVVIFIKLCIFLWRVSIDKEFRFFVNIKDFGLSLFIIFLFVFYFLFFLFITKIVFKFNFIEISFFYFISSFLLISFYIFISNLIDISKKNNIVFMSEFNTIIFYVILFFIAFFNIFRPCY